MQTRHKLRVSCEASQPLRNASKGAQIKPNKSLECRANGRLLLQSSGLGFYQSSDCRDRPALLFHGFRGKRVFVVEFLSDCRKWPRNAQKILPEIANWIPKSENQQSSKKKIRIHVQTLEHFRLLIELLELIRQPKSAELIWMSRMIGGDLELPDRLNRALSIWLDLLNQQRRVGSDNPIGSWANWVISEERQPITRQRSRE